MLNDVDAIANLAVKDLKVARQFYEDTLGLEPVEFEGRVDAERLPIRLCRHQSSHRRHLGSRR
jgi:catechol 2,3-dioxygenase-like lactoylglutathione lyase family enzyme